MIQRPPALSMQHQQDNGLLAHRVPINEAIRGLEQQY